MFDMRVVFLAVFSPLFLLFFPFFSSVHARSCLEYLRKRICRRLVCSEHAAYYAQFAYILSLPPETRTFQTSGSGRGHWKQIRLHRRVNWRRFRFQTWVSSSCPYVSFLYNFAPELISRSEKERERRLSVKNKTNSVSRWERTEGN